MAGDQGGERLQEGQKARQGVCPARHRALYKALIHHAVVNKGEYDPYTGEKLAWELVSTWDTSRKQPEGYEKKFALLPTIDHVVPDALEPEICSWQVNKAKNDLTPQEFVALCRTIVKYGSKNKQGRG